MLSNTGKFLKLLLLTPPPPLRNTFSYSVFLTTETDSHGLSQAEKIFKCALFNDLKRAPSKTCFAL